MLLDLNAENNENFKKKIIWEMCNI